APAGARSTRPSGDAGSGPSVAELDLELRWEGPGFVGHLKIAEPAKVEGFDVPVVLLAGREEQRLSTDAAVAHRVGCDVAPRRVVGVLCLIECVTEPGRVFAYGFTDAHQDL